MIVLKPLARRITYVAIFEVLAIFLSTILLMAMNGGGALGSLPVAVAVSVIAVLWNFIFNTGFEWWEHHRGNLRRTFLVRAGHATGFEVGLFLFTIPLYMWWYSVGIWTAIQMEAAILVFFFAYTFVFTWSFDAVFSLEQPRRRAQPGEHPPAEQLS